MKCEYHIYELYLETNIIKIQKCSKCGKFDVTYKK